MTADGQQKLSETLAKQVLERAAQLDASDRMSVSVPDLRTAAVEAGISSSALDQALREISSGQAVPAPAADAQADLTRAGRRWRMLAVIVVVIALLGATVVARMLFPGQ